MTHTAAFNALRRSMYRLGREKGLRPRDAGHLYSPDQARPKIVAALVRPPRVRTMHQPPVEVRRTRRTDPHPGAVIPFEREHVLVEVTFEDSALGVVKRHLTVAQSEDDRASLGKIVDRTNEYIRRNEDHYKEHTRKLLGITILRRDVYAEYGE
jgi:hypothetical protein